VVRELVLASGDNVEVRERAIRSLSESAENDSWLREQYPRIDRVQLQERLIRRLGDSSSEANFRWLRTLVLNANERVELRERGLRVIGDDVQRHDEVRDLFSRLNRTDLKERALRVIGEKRSPEGIRWIRQVAADANESTQVRDRAIRLLGEYESTAVRDLFERLDSDALRDRALRLSAERNDSGTSEWLRDIATGTRYSTQVRDRALRLFAERAVATSQLVALYDDVSGTDLQRRVIRLLAERDDDAAIAKLRTIAENDPSRDLRRYAMRRLAEMW
jgi:hypothetical protein